MTTIVLNTILTVIPTGTLDTETDIPDTITSTTVVTAAITVTLIVDTTPPIAKEKEVITIGATTAAIIIDMVIMTTADMAVMALMLSIIIPVDITTITPLVTRIKVMDLITMGVMIISKKKHLEVEHRNKMRDAKQTANVLVK